MILSLTTIYSVMAFTVSRRTREIGVRVALGSNRRRIVLSVLRRPLTHVATGIAVGAEQRECTNGKCGHVDRQPRDPAKKLLGFHAYRRKWATERKHLPVQDVAEAGGWLDTRSLEQCYQQADEATLLQVV